MLCCLSGTTYDVITYMSLEKHVTSTCKAYFFHLRNISRIRVCLSLEDTEKLIHAFITSKLDNANSLLYGLPKFLIDRLQNVQNAAARVVTRTRKYDRVNGTVKYPPSSGKSSGSWSKSRWAQGGLGYSFSSKTKWGYISA